MTTAFKIADYYIWSKTYEEALKCYYMIIRAKGEDCAFIGHS